MKSKKAMLLVRVTKAKEDGESEFEVDGKTYKVKESSCDQHEDDEVEEGNAFGAVVTKAKENGDTEFEVDGKAIQGS